MSLSLLELGDSCNIILSFLDGPTLLSFSQCSQTAHKAGINQSLWEKRLMDDYGNLPVPVSCHERLHAFYKWLDVMGMWKESEMSPTFRMPLNTLFNKYLQEQDRVVEYQQTQFSMARNRIYGRSYNRTYNHLHRPLNNKREYVIEFAIGTLTRFPNEDWVTIFSSYSRYFEVFAEIAKTNPQQRNMAIILAFFSLPYDFLYKWQFTTLSKEL